MRRKASSRIFPISSLTSLTSSTKDSTASFMNALSGCSVELQLFLFLFDEGGVSSFCIQFREWQKTCVNQLPKPKLWKNKQKLINKNLQCILSGESNTLCFKHNFYYNFTNKCDVFQESFAENFFFKIWYTIWMYSPILVSRGCSPVRWLGEFSRGFV